MARHSDAKQMQLPDRGFKEELASLKVECDVQLAAFKVEHDAQLAAFKVEHEAQMALFKAEQSSFHDDFVLKKGGRKYLATIVKNIIFFFLAIVFFLMRPVVKLLIRWLGCFPKLKRCVYFLFGSAGRKMKEALSNKLRKSSWEITQSLIVDEGAKYIKKVSVSWLIKGAMYAKKKPRIKNVLYSLFRRFPALKLNFRSAFLQNETFEASPSGTAAEVTIENLSPYAYGVYTKLREAIALQKKGG